MESEYDSYDYEDVAEKPRLFAFLYGWFGQKLLSDTYNCDGVGFNDPARDWDQCAHELFRLAVMACAWRDVHASALPEGLTALFHDLVEEYSPAGYRSSSEAIQGPADAEDPREHRTAVDHWPRDYWPDLLTPTDELTGRLGELIGKIRKLLTVVGRWTEQENALHAGAALARYATGPWFDPDRDQVNVERWLDALVDLELLANLDELKDLGITVNPRPDDREKAQARERSLAYDRAFELFRNLPLLVCGHKGCSGPPRRPDARELPDLEAAPPDVPPHPAEPPITLQGEDQPILVLGQPKECPSDLAYFVLSALKNAFPDGVPLSRLTDEASDARGILRRLRKDADWQRVIHMPGRTGKGGYRLVWPDD